MDVHKNARTCPLSRALLVQRVFEQGWSVRAASEAVGITDRRGREWLRRAMTGAIEAAQALDIDVQELARPVAFVADEWRRSMSWE